MVFPISKSIYKDDRMRKRKRVWKMSTGVSFSLKFFKYNFPTFNYMMWHSKL